MKRLARSVADTAVGVLNNVLGQHAAIVQLDEDANAFIRRGIDAPMRADFEHQVYSAVEVADELLQARQNRCDANWKSWIDAALLCGAGPARDASRTKAPGQTRSTPTGCNRLSWPTGR